MAMFEYSIVFGHDGRAYMVFDYEQDADTYEDTYGLKDVQRYCCNGYMNAFLYEDVFSLLRCFVEKEEKGD